MHLIVRSLTYGFVHTDWKQNFMSEKGVHFDQLSDYQLFNDNSTQCSQRDHIKEDEMGWTRRMHMKDDIGLQCLLREL